MKIKKGFILREVAGNYIVVATGKASKNFNGLITLNETGAFLWKLLEEEQTKASLLKHMLNEYDIDEAIASNDIDNFLKKIQEAKLVD